MFLPKIMFVDGPNASGKDYFIEQFVKINAEENPKTNIVVLNLKDRMNKNIINNNKKYEYFNPSSEVYLKLFEEHLEALGYISNLIYSDKIDTLIVNRSFISFIIYNMLMPLSIASTPEKIEYQKHLSHCVTRYKSIFNMYFNKCVTLYVNLLDPKKPTEYLTDEYVSRINARNPEVPANRAYINELIKHYRNIDKDITDMFTFTEEKSSSDSAAILSKYSY